MILLRIPIFAILAIFLFVPVVFSILVFKSLSLTKALPYRSYKRPLYRLNRIAYTNYAQDSTTEAEAGFTAPSAVLCGLG